MNQKNIALELLVRSGNTKSVEQFLIPEELDEVRKKEKITEAGVYSAIKYMWEQAEGGLDSEKICLFFNQDKFTNYFLTVNNTNVLQGIIDVLQAGTEAQMEAYAQITAIEVLGVESLAGAIRRNIDAPNMRNKLTGLVQSGYSLVFCAHDIDAEMVDYYFPIIDKWREFVNPQKIAEQTIANFTEIGDRFDYNYQKDFVYKVLDKLVELTNRETVSKLVYEHFKDSDDYQKFIDDNKVDVYTPVAKPNETVNANLIKALQKYERDNFPSNWDVKDLANAASNDKEYIAQKMGTWFKEGKMKHFSEVAKYRDGELYNHDIARKVVGEGIAEASNTGNLTRLEWVLDLPKHLIDETNPAISEIVIAYNIYQRTKGQ